MAQPSRTSHTRAANARPSIGGDAVGTLHVDTASLSSDYELMWATESVLGADTRENVRLQMQTRGFQPVMVSEMPSEAPPLLPGERHDEHAIVRRGGLVLMKREKRRGAEERKHLARENAEALRSVNREFEEGIRGREGLETLKDGGVSERIQRHGPAAFPE